MHDCEVFFIRYKIDRRRLGTAYLSRLNSGGTHTIYSLFHEFYPLPFSNLNVANHLYSDLAFSKFNFEMDSSVLLLLSPLPMGVELKIIIAPRLYFLIEIGWRLGLKQGRIFALLNLLVNLSFLCSRVIPRRLPSKQTLLSSTGLASQIVLADFVYRTTYCRKLRTSVTVSVKMVRRARFPTGQSANSQIQPSQRKYSRRSTFKVDNPAVGKHHCYQYNPFIQHADYPHSSHVRGNISIQEYNGNIIR